MTFIGALLLAAALGTPAQAPEQPLLTLSVDQLPSFDAHQCIPARVQWIDAMIVTRGTDSTSNPTSQDIELSIPRLSSYGCVNQTASAIVIIHSFSRGAPDDYLVVPRGWITEINPFKFAEDEPAAPEPKPSGIQLSQK